MNIKKTIMGITMALVLLVSSWGIAEADNDPSWMLTDDGFSFSTYFGTNVGSNMVLNPLGPARYLLFQGENKGTAGNGIVSGDVRATTSFHHPNGPTGSTTYHLFYKLTMTALNSTTRCWGQVNGANYLVCGLEYYGEVDIAGVYEFGAGFYAQGGPAISNVDMSWTLEISLDPLTEGGSTLTALSVNVFLDHDVYTTQYSSYVANFRDYINEANDFFARYGVNKRFIWNGNITESDQPFNYGTGCNFSDPVGRLQVDIWFRNADFHATSTIGRECNGHSSIIVGTLWDSLKALPGYADAKADEGDIALNSTYFIYWFDTVSLMHELAHTFGASMDEMYYFRTVNDGTSTSPLLNVNDADAGDKWWNGDAYYGGVAYSHPGLRNDIMIGIPDDWQTTFAAERTTLKISPFTAKFLNTWNYLGRMHIAAACCQAFVIDDSVMTKSITTLTVTQWDGSAGTGNRVAGIHIKAWWVETVMDSPLQTSYLIGEYVTDANGQVVVQGRPNAHDPAEAPGDGYDTVLIKSYTVNGGVYTQYGRTQIVDEMQLENYVFANGTGATTFPVTMGKDQAYLFNDNENVNGGIYTGYATESTQGSGVGGSNCTSGCALKVGDTAANQGVRSIIQFDTSSIPNDAVVTGFVFQWYIESKVGSLTGFGPPGNANAYSVQMKDTSCFGLCQIENSDFERLPDIGFQFNYAGSTGVWETWTDTCPPGVTCEETNSINKTGVTEFKFRWYKVTDADGVGDQIRISTAGSTHPPLLTVTYYLP